MISGDNGKLNIPQGDWQEQIIPEEYGGMRVDQVLTKLWPDYSRSWFQGLIRDGLAVIEGEPCLPKLKVNGGELIRVLLGPQEPQGVEFAHQPEDIDLDILYQDEHILVLNKPVGLVVHPGAGNPSGTLQNALLHHFPSNQDLPRYGIIHRLDKDTSGVMAVALSHKAHTHLTDQIQKREVGREYLAVVQGSLVAGGTVNEPIGRSDQDRKKMTVRKGGREAITHYRIDKRFQYHTSLTVKLETGRTHQIRVHMAHIRRPIVGDPVYGGRFKIPKGCSDALADTLRLFKRQALHARRLELYHPASQERCSWEAPVPGDMKNLLDQLQQGMA